MKEEKEQKEIFQSLLDLLDPIYKKLLEGDTTQLDFPDYSLIPDYLMEQIKSYVEKGEPLCGFLNAIFSNDLMTTVAQADHNNIGLIPLYCKFIWNELPHTCHGSCEAVYDWIESKKDKKCSD